MAMGLNLQGLVPVEQLHVTLLYLGGRSAAKAAPLNDLSVEDLELMSQALQEMKGMEARDCSTTRKMTSLLQHQIKLRQPQLSCMFLLIYRSTLM